MKQTAFVNITPLTTSKLGRIVKTKIALPIVGKDSVNMRDKNSHLFGLFHDLNKHILTDLIKVPICGTQNIKIRIQIHAALSISGTVTSYCLFISKIVIFVCN